MPENIDNNVAGLLDAVHGLLPTCDQRRAAVILAATVHQLSQTINYRAMLVADGDSQPEPAEKDWEQWN